MAEESLSALVAGLRSELAKAHNLDPEVREGLHSLARECEAVLHTGPTDSQVVEPALRDRLTDRITALEVSHPKLSSALGNIVDTLGFYNL